MKKYRQLAFEDRIYLEVMHWQRAHRALLARLLGVHPSTIYRELQRGSTGDLGIGYRADLAEKEHRVRLSRRGRPRKIVGPIRDLILEKLKAGWSPEQISGRLKLEGKVSVSHETIYRFISEDRKDGGTLYLSLRHGRRRRKKRFSVPRIRTDLLYRRSIEQRPKVINERKRIGDWERDLMFGDSRRAALMTFVERKTQFVIIRKVESKSPHEIAKQTIEVVSQLGRRCRSITNDNGFEFREHRRESKELHIPIYFTRPYSSWEKGTCENANGLIRQYFPKDSSMEEMTNEKVTQIQEALNARPRKKLGFRTPAETLFFDREFASFL